MSVKAMIGVEFATQAQAQAFLDQVGSGSDTHDPLLAAEYAIRGKLGDVADGDAEECIDPIYLDVYIRDFMAVIDAFEDPNATGREVIGYGEGVS